MSVTEGLAAMFDGLAAVMAVAAGYRERALAAGFSPEIAEQMAARFHDLTLTEAFRQAVAAGAREAPTDTQIG